MSPGVKRKNTTVDDLMRRLEDPGRQLKRPRLDSGSTQDNEVPFTGFQYSDDGTEEDDVDEKFADEEGRLFSGRLRKSQSPTYASSDNSESFEVKSTNVGQPDLQSRYKAHHVDFDRLESSLSRIKVPHRPEPREVDPRVSSKMYDGFSSLGLSDSLVRSMNTMSIRRPTLVQAACIPALLEGERLTPEDTVSCQLYHDLGRDCIGNAKTGSGKTVAFALPILQKLSLDPYGIFALVLTPTRYERCSYIHYSISTDMQRASFPNIRSVHGLGKFAQLAHCYRCGWDGYDGSGNRAGK